MFRLVVLLDAATGLHPSELFALKWGDLDFSDLHLDVLRSIYLRHIGDCKTEASRKPVLPDQRLAAYLWLWKETTWYRQPTTGHLRARVLTGSIRSREMPYAKNP